MKHEFDTVAEALQAGYRKVNRHKDKDTSGAGSYGYSFMSQEGDETVTVWFIKEKNMIGGQGSFIPMYPPKEG